MRIVVCIKQVPSTNKVVMDPVKNTIIREGKTAVINPNDLYALELAITLKERYGAHIIVFSMGIPATERLLRDCVARGADEAVLLSDRAFAGADTLATSYTLSRGIEAAGGVDLIFCGKMAIDGDTAHIGPQLAVTMGLPHVGGVFEITELDRDFITIRRLVDTRVEKLKIRLPALLATGKDINLPRMPSISGIRRSLGDVFLSKGAAAIGADPSKTGLAGSPTQVLEIFTSRNNRTTIPIEGEVSTQLEQILALVTEAKK